MRVLFATAELAPLARVGGLGEASAGLVRALRAMGVEVDVVLPDYSALPLEGESVIELALPAWAGAARARTGDARGFGRVTLIEAPGLERVHPYNDPTTGVGWPDNDRRFFVFSAAIAALVERVGPELLHLNDWHTSAVLGMLYPRPPTVLTIHNLAYQGATGGAWLATLPHFPEAFAWFDGCNPLAGGVTLADRVVAVSPTYAREIVRPGEGFGLDDRLRARGAALCGIRNGIDTTIWNPATDPHLVAHYSVEDLAGKATCRSALLAELGWQDTGAPLVGMVTRLTAQKGIDIALDVAADFRALGVRAVLLGSGERALADRARTLAATFPDVLRFREDFDEPLARRIFSGADLLLMPSRFEPCGLTQMQAMAYGTIPVVTDVGGLHDTVIDDDRARWQGLGAGAAHEAGTVSEALHGALDTWRQRDGRLLDRPTGTGFVASSVDAAGVTDALRRAVRAWRQPGRRRALQEQGMREDWSWRGPARDYLALYESLL